MRTTTHACKTNRISLPRRLVPRRPYSTLDRVLITLSFPPLAKFCVGDMLKIEGFDGSPHFVTILGIDPAGKIDAIVYDGNPHHFETNVSQLSAQRIVSSDRMGPEDVAMYRVLVGLDVDDMEVAA